MNDDDQIDHTELLKGFTCPDERARAARGFGLVGDEHQQLACSGSGPDALINRAAFEATKSLVKPAKPQKTKSKKTKQPPPRACPNCGHIDA